MAEKYTPDIEIQSKPEVLKDLQTNVEDLKNVIAIRSTSGLEAFKKIFSK